MLECIARLHEQPRVHGSSVVLRSTVPRGGHTPAARARNLASALDGLSAAVVAVIHRLDAAGDLGSSGISAAAKRAYLVRGELGRMVIAARWGDGQSSPDPMLRAVLRRAMRAVDRLVTRLSERPESEEHPPMHRAQQLSLEIVDVLAAVAVEVQSDGALERITKMRATLSV